MEMKLFVLTLLIRVDSLSLGALNFNIAAVAFLLVELTSYTICSGPHCRPSLRCEVLRVEAIQFQFMDSFFTYIHSRRKYTACP